MPFDDAERRDGVADDDNDILSAPRAKHRRARGGAMAPPRGTTAPLKRWALERVVAGFNLLFLFFGFCICSLADDDDTTHVVTGPFRFALPQAFE